MAERMPVNNAPPQRPVPEVLETGPKPEAGRGSAKPAFHHHHFEDFSVKIAGFGGQGVILAGIIVPKSAAMLRYMDSSVAGVTVPRTLIERMEAAKARAGDDKQRTRVEQEEEGIRITVELIEQVRETEGVRGVHIQAIEWEKRVPEIVERAGLLPRPTASDA
jgi:methylenetetrahydrofolate reductase (NADPH)